MSEQVIVQLIREGLAQYGGNVNRIAQRIEEEVIAPLRDEWSNGFLDGFTACGALYTDHRGYYEELRDEYLARRKRREGDPP